MTKRYEWTEKSGSGGTSDYNDLTNKPQLQGTTLQGNKTADDLGLATKAVIAPTTLYAGSGGNFLGATLDFYQLNVGYFEGFTATTTAYAIRVSDIPLALGGTPDYTFYAYWLGCMGNPNVLTFMVNSYGPAYLNPLNYTGTILWTYTAGASSITWVNIDPNVRTYKILGFSYWPWATTGKGSVFSDSVAELLGTKIFIRRDPVNVSDVVTSGNATASSSSDIGKIAVTTYGRSLSLDYNTLLNKPSIDGVTLTGNQVADSLGLASKGLVESLDGDVLLLRTDVDALQENVSDLQSNKSDIYSPIVPESISLADLPVGYDFIGKTIDFSSITASLFESVSDVDVIRLDRYDAGGINNQVYQAFALGSISNHTVAGYVDCYVSTIMGVTEISGGTPVFLYSNTSHNIVWQGDFATNKTYTFTAFNLYPSYTTMTDKIIEGSTATQISTLITMSAGLPVVADCESNYHRIVGLEASYPTITSDQITSGVQGEDGVVYRYISSDPTETFRYAVWSPIAYPDWGVGAYMYVVFNPLSGTFMETAIMHGQIPYADAVAIRSFANAKQLSVPSYPPVGGYGWLAYKHETSGMRYVSSDLTPMDYDEYMASDKAAKYGPLGSTFFVTQGNTLKAAKIVYNTDVQTQGYKVVYYSTPTSVINCAVSLTPGSTVIVAGVGYYAAPVVGSIMQIFTT